MRINEVRKLEGSGSNCLVQLCKTEKSIFVRKRSKSIEYNARLEEQCRKQDFYAATAGVRAPEVIAWDYEDGLFYFDMEYIHGHTLAELVLAMKTYDVAPFIGLLFKLLHCNEKGKKSEPVAIFGNHILHLEQKLSGQVPEKAISKLKEFDWSIVNCTPCHGDLALDNVIVDDEGNIFLIDFLDSFYDSWMMDVAKVMLDMDISNNVLLNMRLHGIYKSRLLRQDALLRLELARDMIIKRICKMENGHAKLSAIYNIMMLQLLNMLACAQDSSLKLWLKAAIEAAANAL